MTHETITWADRAWARIVDYRWPLGLGVVAGATWLLRTEVNIVGGSAALALGRAVRGAISLPLLQGIPGFYYMKLDWDQFAALFGAHIRITLECVAVFVLIALPLGTLVSRFRRLYLPAFVLLDAVYAIPSVAVFPVLVQDPRFGVSDATVIVVVAAYAQFILARNVVAGLDSVAPEVKESARGMGMSRPQIFLRIEVPLALPVVVAGMRIATVAGIGIAAIAALTGVADLGFFLFAAQNSGGVNAQGEVEAGAFGVIILALGADIIFRGIERLIPANRMARASR